MLHQEKTFKAKQALNVFAVRSGLALNSDILFIEKDTPVPGPWAQCALRLILTNSSRLGICIGYLSHLAAVLCCLGMQKANGA